MTEEKNKHRGWVKNAIIIFLVVMLALTFLSNTIMNHSLPEVAVQTAQSGTITAQVRGTGTVAAVQSYDVTLQEERTVKTVNVTVGQAVTTGDVLFTLDEGESSTLTDAQTQLDSLRLEYQKALIGASDFDYAKENREVKRLRENLTDAIADRDALAVSDEAYTAAKNTVTSAESDVAAKKAAMEKAQAALDAAQTNLDSVTQGSGDYSSVSAAESAWQQAQSEQAAAETELTQAKNALDATKKIYAAQYAALEAEAKSKIYNDFKGASTDDEATWLSASANSSTITKMLPTYIAYAAEAHNTKDDSTGYYEAYQEINTKQTVVIAKQSAVDSAKSAVSSAYASYQSASNQYYSANSGNAQYTKYKKAYDDAKATLTSATSANDAAASALTKAQDALSKLDTQKESYKTAADNVKTIEDSIEDKLFDLAQQQKTDSETQQLESLDLQAKKDAITKQEELVEKLSGGNTSGNEVLAQVSGVIKSIAITAGNTTTAGTAMATIEIPDMGYSLELTVTTEQSRKVAVGDEAQVSNSYYWGTLDISAKLVNIKTDPKSPQQSKILVFNLTGADVETGSQVTLSIGAKSKSYETVIPNSAVRTDSNGSFVYLVVAKSSPIGNRYVAQRVDIEVQESDDTNSAVTGGLAAGDYVITTSTSPIESGMYVKLPEG